MATRDPRLANEALLRLAAFRLTHDPRPLPPWPEAEGLHAVLEAARRLPQRDPWDLPGVYQNAPGLAGLLWEARQQTREGEG
jgi:hypothetical protein